jgi:hypothetical protein
MPAAKHLLAQIHQFGHTVFPIAHELLQLARNEAHDLGLVEAQAAREAALRQLAHGGEEELVLEDVSGRGGVGSRWSWGGRTLSRGRRSIVCRER